MISRVLLVVFLGFSSLLCFAQEQSPPTETTTDDNPLVYSISLKYGWARDYTTTTNTDGGVSGADDLDDSGMMGTMEVVFDTGWLDSFMPYVDFGNLQYRDRDSNIISAGLRHDFILSTPSIAPFAAFGVGYNFFNIKSTMGANSATITQSRGQSWELIVKGGFDYYFNDKAAINLTARYDDHDITTTIIEPRSATTSLHDDGSLSFLLGFTYRLGTPPPYDDGLCKDTPKNVPTDNKDCPLKVFSISVTYDLGGSGVGQIVDYPAFSITDFMQQYPNYKIKVTGYTDSTGTLPYNLKLSKQRAEQVEKLLVRRGVDESRIEVEGAGQSNPVATNDTAEGRAKNRRVELEFYQAGEQQ